VKTLLAALLLSFSINAHAVLPQALTLILHGVGGYMIAMAADKLGHQEAGVPVSAIVGVAKEFSDLNFNVPDAIMWPLGAGLYNLAKKHPEWQWDSSEYYEIYWYMDNKAIRRVE